MIDLKNYMVTTALAKATKNEARTFQRGEDLTPASAYLAVVGGKIRHWAPTTGAATSSVHRTRAEIVGEPFYIKDFEQSISDYEWYAEKVNYFGQFVFQQMHCDGGNDPTLKRFANITDPNKLTGQILYGLRTTSSSSDPKKKILLDNVDFTQPVRTKITLLRDGTVIQEATQGSNTAQVTDKLSAERAARPHVFHWGPYNQIDMGAPEEPAGDGTLLWSTNIDEYHGATPVVVEPPPVTPPVVTPPVTPPARTLQNVSSDVAAQLNIWRADHAQAKAVEAAIQTLKLEADTFPVGTERTAVYKAITTAREEIRATPPVVVDPPVDNSLSGQIKAIVKANGEGTLSLNAAKSKLNAIGDEIDEMADGPEQTALYTQLKAATIGLK